MLTSTAHAMLEKMKTPFRRFITVAELWLVQWAVNWNPFWFLFVNLDKCSP